MIEDTYLAICEIDYYDECNENTDTECIAITNVANYAEAVEKAENYYGHFILTTKEGKFLTPVTADQAVLEVYDEIYNDSFSATATGLYVYYDLNNDGVADIGQKKVNAYKNFLSQFCPCRAPPPPQRALPPSTRAS